LSIKNAGSSFGQDVIFLYMRHLLFIIAIIAGITTPVKAQQKWNLLQCIQYAMENNLTVKQTALQEKFSELTLKQSKLSQYPNLDFSNSTSFNSGRNQNPTSYSLTTQSYLSNNLQLQTSGDIFNFFSKKNTIAANQWELLAAKANTDKLKNDIALTVANFYLQALLATEQVEIAGVQLQQSKAQYNNTRQLVDAGNLPELNAAELEAQVARDSANVITARGNVTAAVLSLKAYMSIDAAQPFEIDTPPVEKIFVEKIADLQPDAVYASALANMPQQKYDEFKLKAAAKTAAAAKGMMYPTLGGFGALSTGYIASRTPIYAQIPSGNTTPTGLITVVNGVVYNVVSPDLTQGNKIGYFRSDAFGTQLSDNFRQLIGISINVPIFNGGSLRTNYEKAKLNIKTFELQKEIDNQKTKQDIYSAYNNAIVALETFNAGKKAVDAAERSYDFAKQRYDVGMLSTFELITNQNNLFTQRLQNILNQFDYVFKMKVLEFYKGQGLKL
jgi:outer membrane protein